MAEQADSHLNLGEVNVTTWTALANGDTGAKVQFASHPDKTVHILGTFGSGGTVSLQGSNDGTNWVILTDPLGNAITLTAEGLKVVMENPLYIRPIVSAGDGTTDLTVILTSHDNS